MDVRTCEIIWPKTHFRAATKAAKKAKDFDELYFYYTAAFSSFSDIARTFSTGSQLDQKLIQTAFECLMESPVDLQKAVLKATINCLLSDQRLLILEALLYLM